MSEPQLSPVAPRPGDVMDRTVTTRRPSRAADIVATRTVVELSQLGADGQPIAFEIEAVAPEVLVPILRGVPASAEQGASEGETEPPQLDEVEAERRLRDVVGAAVVSPKVSFDEPRPDHVLWKLVHPDARAELIAAIVKLSGVGGLADAIGSFPPGHRRGRSDGLGDHGPGEVRGDAADGSDGAAV